MRVLVVHVLLDRIRPRFVICEKERNETRREKKNQKLRKGYKALRADEAAVAFLLCKRRDEKEK